MTFALGGTPLKSFLPLMFLSVVIFVVLASAAQPE